MKKLKHKKGQIMILSVLLLSAAILGATTVASMIVLFQLKRTSGAEHSARAIFAADAGVEEVLYRYFGGGCPPLLTQDANYFEIGTDQFDIDVSYQAEIDCGDPSGDSAESLGESNQAHRAFGLSLGGMCDFGGQTDACP